jgi:predicted small secreted protein
MKKTSRLIVTFVVLLIAAFVIGCSPTMSGAVKDDTTLTDTSSQLKTGSDVGDYKGPKLRVGVVNFQNKTP